MDNLVQSLIIQTVQNDTHAVAQGLSNDGNNAGSGAAQSTNSVSMTDFSADITTTETDAANFSSVTPTNAVNLVYLAAVVNVAKTTADGTCTIRIKEGSTTLASNVGSTITAGTATSRILSTTLVNVTVAVHTYKYSIQFSTSGGFYQTGKKAIICVSSAATLTGSAGTCQ